MNRDVRIDTYKGLLMWGVVWGHCINCLKLDDPISVWIHSFFRTYDMPFFMLLSGFFLAVSIVRYDWKQLLCNKLTTILVPTIIWSLVISRLSSVFGYYFLWAVFVSSVVVILVEQIKQRSIRFTLYGLLIAGLHCFDAPFNLAYLFPPFLAGYYGFALNRKEKGGLLAVILLIFVLCLCYWRGAYTIWNAGANVAEGGLRVLGLTFYRDVMAAVGIVVMVRVFDMLHETLPRVGGGGLLSFIQHCGRETLALYIFHNIVLYPFVKMFAKLLKGQLQYNIFALNSNLLGYIIAPLLSLFIMYVCLIAIGIVKSKLRWLLGFKYDLEGRKIR